MHVYMCVHVNLHMYEHCAQHWCRKRRGGAGRPRPPQYFTLETLLIFIHAAQIAVSQCILCSASPKWNCFLRLRTAQMYFVLLVLFPAQVSLIPILVHMWKNGLGMRPFPGPLTPVSAYCSLAGQTLTWSESLACETTLSVCTAKLQ